MCACAAPARGILHATHPAEAIGPAAPFAFVRRAVTAVLLAPIRFYRRWISPYTPPTCRFSPTCSAYAEEALRTHGPLRGGWLTVWRILRCQPFTKGGHDPVPPPRR